MKTSTFTLCIVVKNGDVFEVSKQASLYNTFRAHTGSQVEDILYIAAAYEYQTLDTIQLHTLTISLDVHASLPSTQKQCMRCTEVCVKPIIGTVTEQNMHWIVTGNIQNIIIIIIL